MSKLNGILLVLLFLGSKVFCQDPGNKIPLLDSLWIENNPEIYFNTTKKLGKQAALDSNVVELVNISGYLKREFPDLNANQKLLLRQTATHLANMVWRFTGDNSQALELFLISHENVADKIVLDTFAWYIENYIAVIYTMKGDYEKAEYFSELLEKSLIYFNRIENLTRFYANKGKKLNSELKSNEAVVILQKGLKLADSINFNGGIFANALTLAELYNQQPQLGSAKEYILQATEILPYLAKDGKYLEKKSFLEIETANYLCSQKNFTESIPLYQEGIRTLAQFYPSTQRREFAKYYTALANAYYQLDSLDQSLNAVSKGVLSLIGDGDVLPAEIDSHQLYAENSFIDLFELATTVLYNKYLQTGDIMHLTVAARTIEKAFYVHDLIRESVVADPSKLIAIHINKNLIESGIEIIYSLYTYYQNDEFFNLSRHFFNRSKSLLYNEKTERNFIIENLTHIDSLKWSVLQNKLIELHNKKFDPEANNILINGEILKHQEQINDLLATYEHLIPPKEQLDNYIEYLISGGKIYAIGDLNGHDFFKEIGLQPRFEILLEKLNEFISQKNWSLDDTVLFELHDFLIAPLGALLPASVTIIPDGAIGYVPFEMIKDPYGDYLLESLTISYSYGYETIYNLSGDGVKPNEIFCLVPVYSPKPKARDTGTRGSIYHLPFAQIEVDSILHMYDGKAVSSKNINKEEIQHGMNNARIFHYAGHAIVDGNKAFLALHEDMNEQDQFTSKEIGLLHFPMDLVVLSACETGLGKLEFGEGIRSLGRSFMEAGARSTIISLWNVNDRSTSQIMIRFYKYLRDGKRKDDALRQAKLDVISLNQKNFSHPYYWAAFIPAGDMRAIYN